MINVIAIVGKIKNCYVKDGKCYFNLYVENDLYEEIKTEVIKCKIWKGIYKDLNPQLEFKDDLVVGVKGRIENEEKETIVIVEKNYHIREKIN